MKQNPCPIVGEVAKPSGVGLDELNRAVESFGAGVADSVLTVVEQTGFMSPEHLDHFFDRLQTAAHGIVRPCVKETFGRPRVLIAPELRERFLDTPCPAGLEVELVQGAKRNRLGRAPVCIVLEPRPFTARQRRSARLSQTAVFLFAHRIDRFTEVLGNVKPVVNDVCLRKARLCRAHESRPHIHRHRFDRRALRRAECSQQAFGRFQLSFRHQIEHPRAVDVSQYADVTVAPFGAFFIQPQIGHIVLAATQHPSPHGTDHDAVDGAPGQPREVANALGGGAGLQQFDHKGFHQKGDPAVAFSPWHGQFFDGAVAVFELGNACFDEGLKLAGIQMPPLAFSPAIDMGSSRAIRGIRPYLALLENNFNYHALIRQGKVNRLRRPRRLQSKKVFVKGSVFHDGIGVFEKLDSPTLKKNSQCI